MADSSKAFDLVFEGEATAVGKMRNDIKVRWGSDEFDLATDEGGFHGGDGTAPPPLALFTAALAGCIMTQIRAFGKRLKVQVDGLDVATRLHWKGTPTTAGPYESEPVGFNLDITLDSPAGIDEQVALIRAATKGCFIEQSLSDKFPVTHRLKTTDGWIDV